MLTTGAAVKKIDPTIEELIAAHIAVHGVSEAPSRRSAVKVRLSALDDTPIRVITETALVAPEPNRALPSAKGDRRPLDERIAAAEREEAVSIALAQPHRRGDASARRSSALGRFCEDHKPVRLGDHCFDAGERYAEIVREEKNALGLLVVGGALREPGFQSLTQEQIEARRDLAVSRKREADAVLVAIMPRLPRAMERLCYDQLDPSIYDHAILAHGLDMLARRAFGLKESGMGDVA